MPYDAAQTQPALRPGERLVAGRPTIFNADLLNLHLAHEAVLASVGADLTGWTWDELTGLLYACRTVRNVRRGNGGLPYDLHWDDADALATRAADARAVLADRVAA